uniref:Collagen triple helix repeat protein n=1 Tax=Angiostrongylus cantonensis TaxID=6313 RepID=A0A0K0DLW1_ANGCA
MEKSHFEFVTLKPELEYPSWTKDYSGDAGPNGLPGKDGMPGPPGKPGRSGLPGARGRSGGKGVCPIYCALDGGVFFEDGIQLAR